MDNFKLATREKLRFNTDKGLLTVEQLWDLSLEKLDALAVSLDVEHKQSAQNHSCVKALLKTKQPN